MQAIILAAGMGKRLKDLTENNTKCMVKVNGTTMVERMLRQLDTKSLSKIVIVVGYEGQKLIDYIATLRIKTEIAFILNPVYDKTNNIYSLYLAKDYLIKEDTLLLESDLIFEDCVLDMLIDDPRKTLALVDKYESWMDGTVVRIDDEDNILDFIPGKKFKFADIPSYYKTVNIYKFSKNFSETHYVPFLEAYSKALGNNEYYEQVLKVITMIDNPEIKAKRLSGQKWYEMDDIQDLDIASSIFADDNDKLDLLSLRFGGYWRYPKMIDFCYLVNPYFPPQRLMDEIRANSDTLITQYPSGMRVNSLLAAKNFGVHQEHIIVGNGAAELIKSLMEHFSGKMGFIRPTFEEYPNRYLKDDSVVYNIDSVDFSYDAEDIINFYSKNEINNLVLINPDNPTGNYISKQGVIKLAEWCQRKNIRLIIDESFVDFAEEEDNSLINEKIIKEFSTIVVVKSISKSYGVPGLRLGICVSGDTELIATMKKDVAIWNINSLAEFYMQIAEKYSKDYNRALIELKRTRERFVKNLEGINNVVVYPSQANYIMIELLGGVTAETVTSELLLKKNILVKNLSSKINNEKRQFLRIAVRNEEDNGLLTDALTSIINSLV